MGVEAIGVPARIGLIIASNWSSAAAASATTLAVVVVVVVFDFAWTFA